MASDPFFALFVGLGDVHGGIEGPLILFSK